MNFEKFLQQNLKKFFRINTEQKFSEKINKNSYSDDCFRIAIQNNHWKKNLVEDFGKSK